MIVSWANGDIATLQITLETHAYKIIKYPLYVWKEKTINFLNSLLYQQLMDANTEDEINKLSRDDKVLDLLSQCGETSVLNVSISF